MCIDSSSFPTTSAGTLCRRSSLKVWRSDDLANWQPMEVDYRATAHKAMISAVDAGNIWVATDTGTILKLATPK